jgi:hypothetical protein
MKAAEARIAWTPVWASEYRGARRGEVWCGSAKVDRALRISRRYAQWDEVAFSGRDTPDHWPPDLSGAFAAFVRFHTMVVRDGIDPKVAQRALLCVDEFRQRMSPDIEGAEI